MAIKIFKNQMFLILTLVLLQNILLSQDIAKTPYKCVINHLNYLNDEDYNPKLAANSFYLFYSKLIYSMFNGSNQSSHTIINKRICFYIMERYKTNNNHKQ